MNLDIQKVVSHSVHDYRWIKTYYKKYHIGSMRIRYLDTLNEVSLSVQLNNMLRCASDRVPHRVVKLKRGTRFQTKK